jgi:hypothetical protein
LTPLEYNECVLKQKFYCKEMKRVGNMISGCVQAKGREIERSADWLEVGRCICMRGQTAAAAAQLQSKGTSQGAHQES